MMLTPFRSHFLKHIPCTTFAAASFIFPTRRTPPATTSLSQPSNGKHHSSLHATTPRNPCTFSTVSTSSMKMEILKNDSLITAPYLSVRIFCHEDSADMLSEALLCFGADSASMDEQDNDEVNNEVCITSTFPVSKDVQDCILCAANSVGLKNIPNYHVEMHDHTDWIKATQESFYPVKVKEGLWIVPQGKTPPDLQAINIVLNPGLAFGTGEHPTTKLCLLLLHNLIKGGESFLDYGTGSGILSIAALKFGAVFSVGFDIDPQSIISAQHNAALNKVGPENLILSLVPDKNSTDMLGSFPGLKDLYDKQVFTETERYDIVIANILLNPLLDLADQIVSYAKPGAVVGLSGIILEQIPSIVERYSVLLDGIVVSKMDDWACISGYKKKKDQQLKEDIHKRTC